MAEATDVWTIGRLLPWTRDHLAGKGVDQPRLCAELLLAKAMGCEKIHLYTRFDEVPAPAQLDVFREWVRAAAMRQPIAHLIGYREFFSLNFKVTPAVLVPRPETEALAEAAIELCRTDTRRDWTVLDMGTGSGCLAVTIAKYVANARVVATDVSAEALAVVRENVEAHGVADRVAVAEADGLDLPGEALPDGGFDVIVSNPPYIPDDEIDALAPEVAQHESRMALSGGPDGLTFYRRIAADARGKLWPGGDVLLEIGAGQCEAVVELFTSAGPFTLVAVHKDVARIDRVVHFRLSS